MKKKYIFLRDDDIRAELEDELIFLVEYSFKYNIPVTYAVEPGNISDTTASFLKTKKLEMPNLVEIIQHGYDHNFRNLYKYGTEFGGKRNFHSQLEDIRNGVIVMNSKFGERNWKKIMAFPYGSYNSEAIQALIELEFEAVTTSIAFGVKNRIKDSIGRLLKKDIIFGKKVAYHMRRRPNSFIADIGTSVNIIKKYIGYDTAIHYSENEIIKMIFNAARYTDFVGILLHHRFHNQNVFDSLFQSIHKLSKQGFEYTTLSEISSKITKSYAK